LFLDQLRCEVLGCERCPRLVAYRQRVALEKKKQFQHEAYWGKPVPGFGDPRARLLIVGLAPAAHGSNRTGRMFTGDGSDGMGSSDFLMRALHHAGYANQPRSHDRDDGLAFRDAYMTAIVRCAPPSNKPQRDEIVACSGFLSRELALLERVRVVVALGKMAFDRLLKTLVERGGVLPRPKPKFAHGVQVDFGTHHPILLGSYHPSRQNTQTKKLTPAMLQSVFQAAKQTSERRLDLF